jgi:hypothetical protein
MTVFQAAFEAVVIGRYSQDVLLDPVESSRPSAPGACEKKAPF